MARPWVLSPEIIEKAKEYILTGFRQQGSIIPSHSGMAIYLGVARSTLYKWKDDSEEFNYILELCGMHQEVALIDGGLLETYNSTITKLLLSKHGYSDKVETDITTNGESVNKPTTINLVGLQPNDDSES